MVGSQGGLRTVWRKWILDGLDTPSWQIVNPKVRSDQQLSELWVVLKALVGVYCLESREDAHREKR